MSKNRANQKIQTTRWDILHTRPYLIITIVIASFIMVVFLIWFMVGTVLDTNKVSIPRDIEKQLASLKDSDRVPTGSFQINMNMEWTFPNSHGTSRNAYVANYIGNTHDVYLTITQKGSTETIYTSPIIPVGATLEHITLDCELEAGDYETILTYHLLEKDGTEHSTLSLNLSITILK